MNIATPDWLTRRDGAFNLGSDNKTWYVTFSGQPHYSVAAMPAKGKFTVAVRQTENGKRFESPDIYDSQEAAIKGGLEELGKELGWL